MQPHVACTYKRKASAGRVHPLTSAEYLLLSATLPSCAGEVKLAETLVEADPAQRFITDIGLGMTRTGFNTVCCLLGQRSAGKVSLRVQQLDVACETKSRDNVFVQIVVSVQYQARSLRPPV